MKKLPSRSRVSRAFTLVEVILSMGIFTLMAAMILTLVIGVSRTLVDSQNKGETDRSFRMTTSEISRLVGSADALYVMDSVAVKRDVNPKLGGDLFVAVYYRNPGSALVNGTLDTTIERIAGFCRLPGANGEAEGGPVYYFDSQKDARDGGWNPIPSATTGETAAVVTAGTAAEIANLLPDAARIRTFGKLADSAFALDRSGKIFINNENGSGALMLARIRNGSPGRYVSNTYAFSVSSRNL